MKKDNKTNAIISEHFGEWGDGYTGRYMTVLDILEKGFNQYGDSFPTDEEIAKACEEYVKSHEKVEIDADGNERRTICIFSAGFLADFNIAKRDICRGISNREITAGDFIACASYYVK